MGQFISMLFFFLFVLGGEVIVQGFAGSNNHFNLVPFCLGHVIPKDDGSSPVGPLFNSMGGGRRSSSRMKFLQKEKDSISVENESRYDSNYSNSNGDDGTADIALEECTLGPGGEECLLSKEKDTTEDKPPEAGKTLGSLEPLERQLIRLEGFDPYVLISVLASTATYATMTSDKCDLVVDGKVDYTAIGLYVCCLGSTLCGLYSTIVFSLSILYGKTALGMDREESYFYFLEKTGDKRLRGFQSFTASLLFFACSILLLACDKLPVKYLPFGLMASASLVAFGFKEWGDFTKAALPIFTNVIPQTNEKK